MNILVISHNQDDDSPYTIFVHDQVRAYQRLGHHVVVVAPATLGKKYTNIGWKEKIKIVDEIKIYYPRNLSISKYGLYKFNPFFGYLAVEGCVKQIIKEFKIDVIHAHTISFDGEIAVRLKEKFHIPVVITTHGSDTMIPVNTGKKKYLLQTCKRADKVVAVSSMLAKKLHNDIFPVEVILNGFNQQWIEEQAEKKPYSIIQVGSLIERKKADITICAFSKVREKFPLAKLTIIGSGAEYENLKKLCKELDLEHQVCFIQKLTNREVLMKMAESMVFVMPSVREGLGIVYLEAMAGGCVTIGTRGEGIEDVITDCVNGFLVEAGDIAAISDRINKIFEKPEEYTDLMIEGKKAAEKLTWESNAKKYIKLFQGLIG